jgi:hypothetical protein
LRAKRVRVIGNVQGENARRVNVVKRSRVGGSVQVVQGRSAKEQEPGHGQILYDENTSFLKTSQPGQRRRPGVPELRWDEDRRQHD